LRQADGWVATSSEGGAIIAQKDGQQLLQSTGGGAGCGLLFPKVKPGHPTVTTVLVSGSSQVRPTCIPPPPQTMHIG